MPTKTAPVLARSIQTTRSHLILLTDEGRFEISWTRCSPKLAKASATERNRAILSPSGYGIHWPLIDEDLAVGPLVRSNIG